MLDLTNYDELVPASLHWEPEIDEIQTKDGAKIESHRGVYRSDTGELIGVVGTHYKVVPHSDLIAGVHEALDSAGLTDAKRTLQVHEGGAKIHGRYTFPKHVIEPAVGDVMELCMDLRTSHNGSWGVALDFQYNRLICTNGMVRGDRIGRNRGRHTENFSITAFLRQMQEAIDMMSKDQERFEKMVMTKVTEDDAEWFFRETIARRPHEFKRTRGIKDKPFEIEREYEKLVKTLMDHFRLDEDKTVWGVYNTLTWWSTHCKSNTNNGATEHNSLIRREERVAAALRSKPFAQLQTA